MNRILSLGLSVALAAQAMSVSADNRTGFYVGLNAGASYRVDHSYSSTGSQPPAMPPAMPAAMPAVPQAPLQFTMTFSTPPAIAANFGYKYQNYRVELEAFWKRADIKTLTPKQRGAASASLNPAATPGGAAPAPRTQSVNGQLLDRGIMINGWYDIDYWGSRWVPFVGGGFGLMDGEWTINSLGGIPVATLVNNHMVNVQANQEDTVFAWRAGGGVSYRVTNNIDAMLRYTFNNSAKMNRTNARLKNHTFGGGLRYLF